MSHLWAFNRRPCCIIRYRHGGTTALYPWQLRDTNSALYHEARAIALAADKASAAEDNVLEFPVREFSGREQKTRPARAPRHGRAKGSKKHRD
jgi:hypothetical protein